MLRRYTFKLYPNAAQDAAMREQARLCAVLWNALLEMRETYYRRAKQAGLKKTSLSAFDQGEDLTAMNADPDCAEFKALGRGTHVRFDTTVPLCSQSEWMVSAEIVRKEAFGGFLCLQSKNKTEKETKMTFEIKTPDMIFVRDTSKAVINGLLAKKEEDRLDIKTANAVTGATNNIIRSFTADLKARLAMRELIESEAKMVEAQNAQAPEQIAAA